MGKVVPEKRIKVTVKLVDGRAFEEAVAPATLDLFVSGLWATGFRIAKRPGVTVVHSPWQIAEVSWPTA